MKKVAKTDEATDLQTPTQEGRATRRRKKLYVEKHLRIHADYVARLEALTPWLETQPDLAPSGKLLLADRMRLAMVTGIDALEARQRDSH